MASVKIGPEFFANTKRDYNNWRFAFVRELAQNSIDCGSRNINVTITQDSDNETTVTWTNDGEPMDEDILVNKFLCMGGTGKNFNNAVGGFGLAKQLIAFCHKSYVIHSGDCLVTGIGGEYELSNHEYLHGTSTHVVIAEGVKDQLISACRTFARYSQWNGTFTVNDEILECGLKKGAFRTELPFGKVYTNNSDCNIVAIRMRGILMHIRYTTLDKCVVVELNEPSCEYLQSSRDFLKSQHANELDEFISGLTVNKRVLDNKKIDVRFYNGSVLKCADVEQPLSVSVAMHAAEQVSKQAARPVSIAKLSPSYTADSIQKVIKEMASSVLDYGFVIHNESGMEIPAHYLPNSDKFGSYSKKLATIWSGMLLSLHSMYDIRDEFLIGFMFDDRNVDGEVTEALFTKTNNIKTYLINPVDIVHQRNSLSRSMKNKYKLTDFGAFISLAAHEFVHGAFDYGYHDENFASKLTDVMGMICNNIKIFRGCM